MKVSGALARKLLSLAAGDVIPRSQLKNSLIDSLLENGVLQLRSRGTRKSVFCPDAVALQAYIDNHFGIADLQQYAEMLNDDDLLRSQSVCIASSSKVKNIRSFKGFLVNCLEPIPARLNGAELSLEPQPGAFTYIYDFEQFIPAEDVTIVGVENGENFRYLERQQYLFSAQKFLFVSRYPQSGDLVRWLCGIDNPYLHFGDFDFSGIRIYLTEFRKYLMDRAEFFIPPGVDSLLGLYGNRDLYERQLDQLTELSSLPEPGLQTLVDLICKKKKGLEQEVLIGGREAF